MAWTQWLRRRRREDELAEELESYLAHEADDQAARGLAADAARRTAHRKLGNTTLIRERAYEMSQGHLLIRLASLWQDGQFAVRGLRRRPWALVSALVLLGLAIGISTAMFTIVDALILRPLPFHEPDRLAKISLGGKYPGTAVTSSVLKAWRTSSAFAAVAGVQSGTALITTDAGAATRQLARVTPELFDLLGGVHPVRGRLFDSGDGRPGTEPAVLLSEEVWRGLYNADPALVGRRITIDNTPMTVVGILPADFRFPAWNTMAWKADTFEALPPKEGVSVYARFAPNVPDADALALATRLARSVDPSRAAEWAQARPLAADQIDAYYRRAVPLLSGGVVLLFLVLCANVSSLLLNGLTARGRELATRAALGASRARLIRLAFMESALCGAGGIVAGAGIGWVLVSAARAILPQAALVRSLNPLDIDARALALASIAGFVATLLAGVLPAVVGTRVDIGRSLQLARQSGTESVRARFTRRALLVSQIALSCTLLLGATLLVRSFLKLVNQDRGFDTSHIFVVRVEVPAASFATAASRAAVSNVLADQVRALPGISLASWSYGTPPGGAVIFSGGWTSDQPGAVPVKMTSEMHLVGPEFFALYGLPVRRGRPFLPSDDQAAVLVSERFARALWPGLDPIGRTFTYDRARHPVIGLVPDLHFPSLDRSLDVPQWYAQFSGVRNIGMLSVRCSSACPDPALVTQRLLAAAPAVKIDSVRALDDFYFRELARPRAAAALAFAFAATALIAVAGGLFSLLSHSVARRRREFGIRTALGASPADVRRLVWRDGLGVTLTGICIGTLAGLSLTRALSSLLFEVTAADPASWSIVAAMLALTIAAASWHPTRSAVRTAPVVLLREE